MMMSCEKNYDATYYYNDEHDMMMIIASLQYMSCYND